MSLGPTEKNLLILKNNTELNINEMFDISTSGLIRLNKNEIKLDLDYIKAAQNSEGHSPRKTTFFNAWNEVIAEEIQV